LPFTANANEIGIAKD